MLDFQLLGQEGAARRGRLTLNHGVVETPIFMPVGTYGTVKGVMPRDLTEMLLAWGASARSWSDAEALLEELPQLLAGQRQESLSPTSLPDILITDHRLPGMTGLHLAQSMVLHLQAQQHPLRCLIISGDTDPVEIARMHASGHDVLAKPFRSEALLEHLQRLRAERSA